MDTRFKTLSTPLGNIVRTSSVMFSSFPQDLLAYLEDLRPAKVSHETSRHSDPVGTTSFYFTSTAKATLSEETQDGVRLSLSCIMDD